MPSSRVAFAEIESYTPALDARAVEGGSIFVLAGRNYVFDVKGPKAGFGSRIVNGGIIDDGIYPVQSLDLGGRAIVCTRDGVYDRRWTAIDDETVLPAEVGWNRLGSLVSDLDSNIGRFKWTSAYVGFGSFICHPSHGIKRVLGNSLEDYSPDGLIDSPMFIAEANGHLVIVGRFQVQWSNAFDPGDLSPELGGSGFQTTSELVPGNPLGVMSFQGGFIVYTDAGVLLFEYVGNEIVFRPDRIPTQQLLLNPNSCTEMSNGEMVLLTKQGLYRSSATDGMSELTPQFNAFLLDLLAKHDDYVIRLDYIVERDQLFVQVMDSTAIFITTYVLTVKLDKWGEFSETHRGIIRFSKEASDYGWVDFDGYCHRIDESPFVELADGSLRGLEADITLGYIRPANGADNADVMFELQETFIAARTTRTPSQPFVEVDWGAVDSSENWGIGFYLYDVDYNNYGVDYYDINYSMPGTDEDWNLGPFEDVDFNDEVSGDQDYDFNDSGSRDEDFNETPDGGVDTSEVIDWGDLADMSIALWVDWGGEEALLNFESYSLEIISNIDGFTELLTTQPSLALVNPQRDLWTGFTSGHEHCVRVSANQPWDKFHVTAFAITVHLAGQYS